MNPAVSFDDVSCKIGNAVILEHITFTIQGETITGILGPNGAGKTTLLSLINGLRKQATGKITLLGQSLPMKDTEIRRRIGVVLQETALYEELTVAENLRFAASLYTVQDTDKRISEVLELFGLTNRANSIVQTLSGGLQRRVAIARALLHEPEVLIVDEPTLGVDVETRHIIWQHLRFLKAKGSTIIVATNYLDEAQALCDMVAVLREGRLLTYETPDALLARAGYCIDVECNEKDYEKVKKAVSNQAGLLRLDKTPLGISLFLKNETTKDQIISKVLKNIHIKDLRVRAPDLVEVFNSLEKTV